MTKTRNGIWMLALLALPALAGAAQSAPVTYEGLLAEMCDRDALTRYPEPDYRIRMWSSRDPRSVAPDRDGWFANHDFRNFLRAETNETGEVEHVLAEGRGPGAVVRIWFVQSSYDREGVVRIRVDGRTLFQGQSQDLLGKGVAAPMPLSAALPPAAQRFQQANNLYLPIPYAESFKITYSSPEYARGMKVYYNVEARQYVAGTKVESLTPEVLKRGAPALAKAVRELTAVRSQTADTVREEVLDLEPQGAWSVDLGGPGAVRGMELAYDGGWSNSHEEWTEQVRVEMTFDGRKTVDLPMGWLFGTGALPASYVTRFSSNVQRKDFAHTLRLDRTMPFARSARVTLRFTGEKPAKGLRVRVLSGPYRWENGRSMHFHATWKPGGPLPTRIGGTGFDFNYATVTGCRGVFAGAMVSVFNRSRTWWGEGDEKVYVDGEAYPSLFGTGTEDHYGYAWCRPERFDHPFVAQPDGSGNLAPGFSVNVRHRVLDAVPFSRSIRYDVEVLHTAEGFMDYQPAAWWYQLPAQPL